MERVASKSNASQMIELQKDENLWNRFYLVSPLVVVGSKEGEHYNLAPKHMTVPLGFEDYYSFVCTPHHQTYRNIEKEGFFTVTYPKPDQVVLASLAASPRCGDSEFSKEIIDSLPTFRAKEVDALFLSDGYLFFECKLDRIIDGFGEASLIVGRIIRTLIDPGHMITFESDEGERIYRNPLLAYLSPGRFGIIKKTFAFPFPKDFEK
jgi:flavin reductase (DIM6/NTAB) family NADH-FMN oxidoreductase RutF